MRLLSLRAKNYRSLRDVDVDLSDMNLFIGANGSGKSAILDALRFLHEGVQSYDFRAPVFSRGGILNLAWKGEEAHRIELSAHLENGKGIYEWMGILRSQSVRVAPRLAGIGFWQVRSLRTKPSRDII